MFYQPAEWHPHQACWLAFPYDRQLWSAHLEVVQAEFMDLVLAIARSEQVFILVPSAEQKDICGQLLQEKLGSHFYPQINLSIVPFGDIWMRDIAPIFGIDRTTGTIQARTFAWNGWGGKYLLEADDQVARQVVELAQVPHRAFPFVLEGGAVEVDGLGTCLTTEQCLLNPNRNPHLSKTQIEEGLREALGVEQILWITAGLENDHTDGHIDTIARFIAPNTVMCMLPDTDRDPNYQVLRDIHRQLVNFQSAEGVPLTVVTIPSPDRVTGPEGEIMPASYLNFYISNAHVIVPTYGSAHDDRAVNAIAHHCHKYLPTRTVLGLPARHILLGGGAFHCITQQLPQVGSLP